MDLGNLGLRDVALFTLFRGRVVRLVRDVGKLFRHFVAYWKLESVIVFEVIRVVISLIVNRAHLQIRCH